MTPAHTTTMRLLAAAALAAACGVAQATTTIRLQPDERSSKDVFLYEFNVPGVFGIPTPPRSTNLDTETLARISPPPVPFGNFLGAAKTEPFSLTPDGPLREHGTRTLIQFDLGFLALSAPQVQGAWIHLYALPALPAFESPSAMHPVTIDLRRVTQSWGEQTATWDMSPAVEAMPHTSVVQDGVGRWVRFEVTSLVRGWLTNPATNMGVELSQRDIVEIPVPDMRDRYVAALYASSAFPDATLRPFLEVSAVPEPSTYAMLAGGLALIGWRVRRRAAAARADD